ncbi:BREX-1 system adenine-specific DNA-methyltransferase PglX [Duncaniella freteri]|uniref:BREX-1 system adenine-specific DNA-methyltransferase PglX n=1 Tax=Duncaniella freteri TaxID=2530391 RepID=UPI0025729736|nr:BREX-1 system adenine-specific DNA-methyltransferase PglX [Duncaniella freteri]
MYFTPNWIVKYMVQNAVFPQVRSNRLPEEDKTYLIDKEAPEEPKKPKDLKVADLACGSGHILNECFDLLYDLYIASGFGRGEAIESIFANNLLGIDIDERARQLATFALMLKACQRDESFADAHILPRILTAPDMPESVENPEDYLPHFFLGNYDKEIAEAWKLVKDAHTLGSIIKFDISPVTRSKMEQKVKEWRSESDIPYGIQLGLPIMDFILALTDSYDAIVMNPPYMGGGKMDNILVKYVKDIYPDSKADLMTVFMEVAIKRTVKGGFWAMINLPSWMFLSSFEALRINIIKTQQIVCLNHNGRGVFGSDFGSVTFVVQNIEPYKEGIYKRLFTEHVQVRSNEVIHQLYLKDSTVYESRQSNFLLIPGTPIGYWLSKPMLENFGANRVGDEMVTREGMATADNERFLRLWSEISIKNFKSFNYTSDKWYPYNKGGQFRKWYGNQDYVVDWSNDGEDIKNNIDPQTGRIRSHNYNGEYAFRKCGTWSAISSGSFSIRYCPEGFLWDSKGACGFSEQNLLYIIGLLNSTVSKEYLKVLAPTVDFKVGDIIRVPLIIENESQILNLTSSCIDVAKADWDAHETSWNFQRNGLLDIDIDKAMAIVNEYSDITGICLDMAALEPTKLEWLVSMNKMNWEAKFIRLHANEEELNRQFIEIYGLQDELNPHVDYEDITILQQGEISLYRPTHGIEFHGGKEEVAKYGEVLEDEGIVIEPQSRILWQDDVLIKQLISYMVGVWMGRYRLDRPGLNIAHHDPTDEEMASYKYGPDNAALVIDDDAIIPILPTGAPFEDNLTEYIANFVRIAWGEASQTDNLNFIEQCLGKKIEDYVQKDFWKDHKKMYQNRPIYWLFSSKKGAFKALVYVHRMHPYTVEQVRTRYLLKYMDWLRSEAQRLEIRDADLTTAERRRLDCLRSDIEECEEYHERLQVVAEQAIPIDLDNGIPANHALFGDILTKLK